MGLILGNILPEEVRSSNCVKFAKRPGALITTQGASGTPPRSPARPLEFEIHFNEHPPVLHQVFPKLIDGSPI